MFTITVNGAYIDLRGASAIMQIKKPGCPPVATLAIGHGLSFGDQLKGQIGIDAQKFDVPADVYGYAIKITFANGVSKTYIDGTATITPEFDHV
jgi:hypothetical protein